MDDSRLREIRDRIDELDGELLSLFLQRMDLVSEVGRYKAANGLAVRNRAREEEVLERVSAMAGSRAPYARRLWEELFAVSRALEEDETGKGA